MEAYHTPWIGPEDLVCTRGIASTRALAGASGHQVVQGDSSLIWARATVVG